MVFKTALLAVVAVVCLMPLSSCGKDDPKEPEPLVPPAPVNPSGDPEDATWSDLVAVPDTWDNECRGNITYQLLVYSFADSDGDGMGDFNGITEHLDYISSLGANAIWLSPIHPASSYHGYDVIDYTKVNPDYGTMDDFERLVDAAHSKGIKVYLDFVMNHTSVDNEWFKTAKGDVNSEYRNYYLFSANPKADIDEGSIPMLGSEGSAAYNAGEWFSVDQSDNFSGLYTFTLDWSDASAPVVTVSRGTSVDADNTDTNVDKFLYYGDAVCKRFYDMGGNKYQLTVNLDTSWGFLIRTSDTTWDGGTKYGAKSQDSKISLDKPFVLNNATAANIVFDSMQTYYYHSHFQTGSFADLNYGPVDKCTESAAYKAMVSVAKGWVDKGVDGLRLDAVKHIYHSAASDENPRFLKTFYDEMNDYYRKGHDNDFYMVGEVLSGYNEVAPYYSGLPALFDFSFWYTLRDAIASSSGNGFISSVIGFQKAYSVVRADYIDAIKLSNHDEKRTGSELGRSTDKEKLAAAVLMTSPGQPYVYYGEELGLYGTQSNGDEYVRSPMLWGDASTTTPFKSIDPKVAQNIASVVAQSADSASLLVRYRQLAQLRNTYKALATGAVVEHSTYNSRNALKEVAAWYRSTEGQKLLVLHNFGSSQKEVTLTDAIDKAVGLFGRAESSSADGKTHLRLGAYTTVVFLVKQ
ncbi:MAG: alpha-amylase family glycosyl hydrolase [Bacteroidales bacterium]|nr:alpha-amylase family glycosyl hydrolase [Bacteroidales bacterium]